MIIETSDLSNDEKILKGFELIFDGINSFSHDSFPKLFVDGITREHRTLQQNFWRSMLGTMRLIAEHDRCDDRNRAALNFCKKVVEFVDKHDTELPTYEQVREQLAINPGYEQESGLQYFPHI